MLEGHREGDRRRAERDESSFRRGMLEEREVDGAGVEERGEEHPACHVAQERGEGEEQQQGVEPPQRVEGQRHPERGGEPLAAAKADVNRPQVPEHRPEPPCERREEVAPAKLEPQGGGERPLAEVEEEHERAQPPAQVAGGVHRAHVARAHLEDALPLKPRGEGRTRQRAEEVAEQKGEEGGHGLRAHGVRRPTL